MSVEGTAEMDTTFVNQPYFNKIKFKKLLYIGWINNEVQLYSTENYI